MTYSYNAYLVVLGHALTDMRQAIAAREPDDYAELCAALVDMIAPIPVALACWGDEFGERLYDDMKSPAALAHRSEWLDCWMAWAEIEVAGEATVKDALYDRESIMAGFSVVTYLSLIASVTETMERNKGDLAVLYALSDVFHDLPDALRHPWTKAHEERIYQTLIERATERGIQGFMEHWLSCMRNEAAKVRLEKLRS